MLKQDLNPFLASTEISLRTEMLRLVPLMASARSYFIYSKRMSSTV